MAICQTSNGSCSSCCGLYNLDFSQEERKKWLDSSTKKFLQLDLTDSLSVYRYRQSVEPDLRIKSILEDVYVCPFLGWLDVEKSKTGCLLHPEGSPHQMTGNLDHPLSHSFYGEKICQNYDCISKSKDLPFDWNLIRKKSDDPFLYGRLVSNHNLLSVLNIILENEKCSIEQLLPIIEEYVEKFPVPVTSFEMPLSLDYYTRDELWDVLGTLFDKDSYGKRAFVITKKGQKTGQSIQLQIEKNYS